MGLAFMQRRTFIVIGILALGAMFVAPFCGQDTLQQEADRLAVLLGWHEGGVVAEIGAGNGKLTLAASQRFGSEGRIYSNELDPQEVTHLRELAAKAKNIVVVQGDVASTNLPPGCCDSIYMRLVYHHFTNPAAMDASLLRSLKPDGRLAVIDEEPRPGSVIPDGVPKNRIGHGIPQPVLIDELKGAGFEVESVHDDWPSDEDHKLYCVIFRKAKP
jgi:SAM-dependent methyltransferase